MYKQLPKFNADIIELEPFSRIRLVAADLDGTMLKSNDSSLPRKVKELARKLSYHKHGVRFTIATGRTLNGSRELLEELTIKKDTPIILYNGSVVVNRNYEILKHTTINNEYLNQVVYIAHKYKVKLIAYFYNWLIPDTPYEYAIGWSSLDKPDLDYNKMPVQWLDWNVNYDADSPSAIVIHTNADQDVTRLISAELNKINGISYTHGKSYVEVGPNDCGKGAALKFAANLLNISQDQVLAIGDNDNDAEMLSWAGIGVGVDSASKLALDNSDYIAERGVVHGAIEVLNLVHAAKRLYQ